MFPQDTERHGDEGSRGFGRARRGAFLSHLGRRLRQRLSGRAPCCESLRCFEEELANRSMERKGRASQTVEVTVIVGSVGRCGTFDAGFLPVCSCSAERWKRVYKAFSEGEALPPVELYKRGGAYFVVDGNHRVSVARYRGIAAVDALVTEFL